MIAFGLVGLPRCDICGVAPLAGLWADGPGRLCTDCAIVVFDLPAPWRRRVEEAS